MDPPRIDLECPVCLTVKRGVEIYACANGHILCGPCSRRLLSPYVCPVCRRLLPIQLTERTRATKVEEAIREVHGNCPANVKDDTRSCVLDMSGGDSDRGCFEQDPETVRAVICTVAIVVFIFTMVGISIYVLATAH